MRDVTVKKVTLEIPGALYAQWSTSEVKYNKCRGGCVTDIEYIDTGEDELNKENESQQCLIVCLHGIGATFKHWEPIINLTKSPRYRFVCPNLPGFNQSKPKNFKCTVKEIAKFVTLLLNHIGISRVDVVISHSGGSHLLPYLSQDVTIKSYFLVCSATHEQSHLLHGLLSTLFFYSYRMCRITKLGQFVALRIGVPTVKRIFGVSVQNPEAAHAAYKFSRSINHDKFREFILSFRESNNPLVIVFAEDDGAINRKSNYEFVSMFGAKPENLFLLSDDNCEEKWTSNPNFPLVFVANSGGHLLFLRKPHLISPLLNNLSNYLNS